MSAVWRRMLLGTWLSLLVMVRRERIGKGCETMEHPRFKH